MRRQKKLRTILFVLLSIVIVCSVSLPAVLSAYTEKKLLANVGEFEDTLVSPENTLDTETRLTLVATHTTGDRAVTLTEQKNIISSGGENAVLSAAIAELKKLSDAGLMPSISKNAAAKNLICSAATYSDAENISSRVTLWKMSFTADSFDIVIWMDAQTHKVFCVSCTNTNFYLSDEIAASFCDAWGSYLGLERQNLTVSDGKFYASFNGKSFEFSSDGTVLRICLSNSGF